MIGCGVATYEFGKSAVKLYKCRDYTQKKIISYSVTAGMF